MPGNAQGGDLDWTQVPVALELSPVFAQPRWERGGPVPRGGLHPKREVTEELGPAGFLSPLDKGNPSWKEGEKATKGTAGKLGAVAWSATLAVAAPSVTGGL